MSDRLEHWQRILEQVDRREPITGGTRATFASTVPVAELTRLAAAEHACCSFLSFAITIDARGVALEVRAPAEGLPVVHALFGGPR